MSNVVIIGAGIAGLAAAETLQNANVFDNISIYEASDRIGGRAWTVDLDGEAMDWGAEALEAGPTAPTAVLEDYGTPIPAPDEPYPFVLYQIPQHTAAANIYANVMAVQNAGNDVMEANVDAMKEYIANGGAIPTDNVAYGVDATPGYTRINALMSEYGPFAESGFLGETSAYDRAYAERLQPPGGTVFFREGIGATVVNWATTNNLDTLVTLSKPITMLENIAGGKIRVTPKLSAHPAEEADYVIVTVPTDVIYSGGLTINDLSGEQMQSFRDCPLGYYHKVAVTGLTGITNPAVNNRFYVTGENMEDLYYIAHSPDGKYCMAHIAGQTAQICNQNPVFAENMLLNVLQKLNAGLGGHPTFYHSDWHANEYIGGAYSYCKVGEIAARRTLAGLKVGNIYFAGEACSLKWYGQLAGAMETGQEAARQILSDFADSH